MNAQTLSFLAVIVTALASPANAEPLHVCATTPDLGDLVRTIGGDAVKVTVFAKPTEDPHFVEPRPSFVKALSTADLYVQTGLDLELGWAPSLLQTARNPDVLPGARGHFDASRAITPLEIPTTAVDRSMGDVHPLGNPHYLLDPRNGLRVAAALRDKLSELRPDAKDDLAKHYDVFAGQLATRLVGADLAEKYDPAKLALLFETGKLESFLDAQGDRNAIGGWLGDMTRHRGAEAVADHNLWPYFADAFGLRIIAFLEPKPGIPPTTRHLQEVIAEIRKRKIRLLLASPYYDLRHADLVARETGAKIASMAHQVGARKGADSYLAMIDGNVRAVLAALGEGS